MFDRTTVFRQVADLIERNPDRYEFMELYVPLPGGAGCLWGLAGEIMEMKPGASIHNIAIQLDWHETGLYDLMSSTEIQLYGDNNENWTRNVFVAARCLREAFPVEG